MLLVAILMLWLATAAWTRANLDHSFGDQGQLTIPIPGQQVDMGNVLVQADGRIVLIGGASAPQNDKLTLLRFRPDGTLDPTFGGTGVVMLPVGTATGHVNARGVQLPGGGLLVAASTAGGLALARFLDTGGLDATWGNGGWLPVAGFDSGFQSLAVHADGKIVIVGTVLRASRFEFAVARLLADGSPDTSFNGNGRVEIAFGSNSAFCCDVLLESDGRIVVAGNTSGISGPAGIVLARLLPSGALDSSFGTGGRVTQVLGSVGSFVSAAARAANGAIVLAGRLEGQFGVARFTASGVLDATFGGTGWRTLRLGGQDDSAADVVVQPDGKIVAIGFRSYSVSDDFAAARFLPDGSSDSTFAPNGLVMTDFAGEDDLNLSMALQADGKIIGAGYAFISNEKQFAVVRYLPEDVATEPARLLAPAPGARVSDVRVLFRLPEPAAPGSVRLRFNDGVSVREMIVDPSVQDAGSHILSFDPRDPTASGVITSGPPIPDGIYSLIVVYQDALGHPAATSLPVPNVTIDTTPYARWKQWNFWSIAIDDFSDRDSDGVPLIAEYALGLNPFAADPISPGPLAWSGGRWLGLSFVRNPANTDVTIEVQTAASLGAPWVTVASSVRGAPMQGAGYVAGEEAGTAPRTVTVRDLVRIGEAPSRFMRVRIQR